MASSTNPQRRKAKSVKAEELLGKALWREGMHFRRNAKDVYGCPSLALKSQKLAIFVDNDLRHGRDWNLDELNFHPNQEYWLPIIRKNKIIDEQVNAQLRQDGWTVLRFWETDVKNDMDECVEKVRKEYNGRVNKLSKKYTFIDLFAGCGGLSEGFLRTGKYEALAHVEWEKPMVTTLRNRLSSKWNHTEEEAFRRVVLFDMQKTDELINGNWSEESASLYSDNHPKTMEFGIRGLVGDKKVNLIIGGPPCQAYSIHGRATDKNSMQDDYRNYLFESFCKVVDAFQPDVFVFENVAGLLSAKPGGIPVRKRIYDAFSSIGYEIKTPENLPSALYEASDFQVPQHRPRVIILGVKKCSSLKLDDLYSSISAEKSDLPKKTVRDAIGDLPCLYPLENPINEGRHRQSHQTNPDPTITQHEARKHSARDRRVFRDWVGNNMNHIGHQEMIDYYYKITGHETLFQKYKSLEWDKPSHTVVAHLSKDGYMFIHPDVRQERSITIREAACLMSFPMDFLFCGNNQTNFRMIGNAVPVLFAESIAKGISNELDKHDI